LNTIYLTASRERLLDNVATRHLLGLDVIRSNSLESFMQSHAHNIAHVRLLFVDLSELFDSNDEIVEALNTLKILNNKLRIIILADNLSENFTTRQDLSELFRRICAKGVYDILVSLSDEVIDHSINIGMTEDEARTAFTPRPKANPEQKSYVSEGHKAVASLFRGDRQEPTQSIPHLTPQHDPRAITSSTSQQNSRCTLQSGSDCHTQVNSYTQVKGSNKMQTHDTATPTIRANKEFRKFNPYVSVGVCGTGNRVGTTHNTLKIVRFLKDIGFRVCYVEAHGKPHGISDIVTIKDHYTNVSTDQRKSLLQVAGLNLFHTGFDMVQIMADKYDFYVFDLGILSKSNINQFLMRDIMVLVSGSKPWELSSLQSSLTILGADKFVKSPAHVIMNFSQKTERARLLEFVGQASLDTHFAEYAPSPFEGGENAEIYKRIFREYILQEEKPQLPTPKKKRGLFGKS